MRAGQGSHITLVLKSLQFKSLEASDSFQEIQVETRTILETPVPAGKFQQLHS